MTTKPLLKWSTSRSFQRKQLSSLPSDSHGMQPDELSTAASLFCKCYGYSLAPGVSLCGQEPSPRKRDQVEWYLMKKTLSSWQPATGPMKGKTMLSKAKHTVYCWKGNWKKSEGTGLNYRSHEGQWDLTDHGWHSIEVKVTSLGPAVLKTYWPLKVSKNFSNSKRKLKQQGQKLEVRV